jgi:hypothetical protein
MLAATLISGAASFAGVDAQAAGALVIGNCGAYGYSHNYDNMDDARTRAMDECRKHKGKNCKQVTTINGNCAAFATDRRRSCGAWGWATRANRDDAEDVAIRECTKAGGRECRIRVQFCDALAAPAMTTNWKPITIDKKECLEKAEKVIKAAGLTKNFEVTSASVFGEQDDYTAQINCITEKGIAMFLLVGPKLERAREHMKAIYDGF